MTARIGTGLLIAVSYAGGVFPWLFEANATHMSNPDWSPHARLHDAIAVITAAGTGLLGAALLLTQSMRANRTLLSLAAAVGLWP